METTASRLRVLVVIDAVLTRRYVREALELEEGIEVVATAPDARAVAPVLATSRPDLVVLDVVMAGVDGLAILREVRRVQLKLPVIVLSLDDARGAAATLDALAAGANDYVTRPPDAAGRREAVLALAGQLLPKVRAHVRRESPPSAPPVGAAAGARPGGRTPVSIVCIGASTGGPNALAEVVSGLTRPLGVPVAIVQHMPPTFTGMLADRLGAIHPGLRCREATAGAIFEPGCALLAPGGRHLGVLRAPDGRLVARVLDTPPENACRPAADVLFRQAVDAAGGGVLAVVLTGMGHDGRRGAERVRAAGGQVIAQDEATSVVWGMPGSVVAAGLADAVLPLGQIAAEITRRAGVVAA